MNKFISSLSDESLSNPAIFYPELLARIVKKNIWQVAECDECLELLLSRKNALPNVVECIAKLVRALVLEEALFSTQQLWLTIQTLKSLSNSKWNGSSSARDSLCSLLDDLKDNSGKGHNASSDKTINALS